VERGGEEGLERDQDLYVTPPMVESSPVSWSRRWAGVGRERGSKGWKKKNAEQLNLTFDLPLGTPTAELLSLHPLFLLLLLLLFPPYLIFPCLLVKRVHLDPVLPPKYPPSTLTCGETSLAQGRARSGRWKQQQQRQRGREWRERVWVCWRCGRGDHRGWEWE
jgi:hypothetical protein